MLDLMLDNLQAVSIQKVVVNTHYLAEHIHDALATRRSPNIVISHEKEILDTGGGIVNALPHLGDEPFFVANGDIVMPDGDAALGQLSQNFNADKMDALMLLIPLANAFGYDGSGDFALTKDGRLIKDNRPQFPYVYSGLAIIKPEIFVGREIEPFSLYRDFLHKKYITDSGELSRVYGCVYSGKWLHVGTPQGLKAAEKEL